MGIKCMIGIHDWQGCKCSQCGKTRDQDHDWKKDCEKCSRCGKTRNGAHDWQGCKCSKCGKIRDRDHDWNGGKCNRCNARMSEEIRAIVVVYYELGWGLDFWPLIRELSATMGISSEKDIPNNCRLHTVDANPGSVSQSWFEDFVSKEYPDLICPRLEVFDFPRPLPGVNHTRVALVRSR